MVIEKHLLLVIADLVSKHSVLLQFKLGYKLPKNDSNVKMILNFDYSECMYVQFDTTWKFLLTHTWKSVNSFDDLVFIIIKIAKKYRNVKTCFYYYGDTTMFSCKEIDHDNLYNFTVEILYEYIDKGFLKQVNGN
jgi:hypothetical protein